MNVKEVCAISPKGENSRNSEGSFLRAPNGDILYAYSRYHTTNSHDHAPCDIYMIRSSDEGESWSEPVCIAAASDFGVANVMSVSGVTHKDGSIGFYFLIKENDYSTTIGRTVSTDGFNFKTSRRFINAYRLSYTLFSRCYRRTCCEKISRYRSDPISFHRLDR